MQARHSRRSIEVIELFVEARFQTSICTFEILTTPNPDYMQRINTRDVPSLLTLSYIGSVATLEMAAELAGLNQRLGVVQIAEVGHAAPYDQPERFSDIFKTFLHLVTAH